MINYYINLIIRNCPDIQMNMKGFNEKFKIQGVSS
jgi:hypothetical protein